MNTLEFAEKAASRDHSFGWEKEQTIELANKYLECRALLRSAIAHLRKPPKFEKVGQTTEFMDLVATGLSQGLEMNE